MTGLRHDEGTNPGSHKPKDVECLLLDSMLLLSLCTSGLLPVHLECTNLALGIQEPVQGGKELCFLLPSVVWVCGESDGCGWTRWPGRENKRNEQPEGIVVQLGP
jgi:hypothetical protein